MKNIKVKPDKKEDQKPLRILPGIIIVMVQWICWLVVPNFVYSMAATATMVFSSLIGGFAFVIWWAFFSRSNKMERWSAVVIMVLSLLIISQISDESIKTGMGGLMYFVYAIPTLNMLFVIWAILSKYFSKRIRYISMVLTILISCGVWVLVRSGGLSGNAKADFNWRWNETKNERLLTTSDIKLKTPSTETTISKAEWPGFRGPNRDGIIWGSNIEKDWNGNPPVELWRWPIGAGCSSFAVHGNHFYTQEQSGEFEVVSCYNLNSGEPVWRHQDSARFYDQHAGAGPRSTPTLYEEFVFTMGATGIINALNAVDGTVIWSRNAASDTDSKDSGWGYTSSPLVVGDLVIVAATGKIIAYNKKNGNPVWIGPDGGDSYSSPHLVNINKIPQILMASGSGLRSFASEDGKIIWEHSWPGDTRILQPAVINDGKLFLNSGMKKGMRHLEITQETNGWEVTELWTSSQMRTDFNDFVVHKKHIYGFEGPTIACIDMEKGERKWKGKRYGGQLILLADQDLLIILTEKGELAAVKADPNQFTEIGNFQAIKGKTWNHPVLVNNILLVRNTKEMVAFRMSK